VRIKGVIIRNFRSFRDLEIDLKGQSAIFIGENGCGKSTLLTGIARAFGRDRQFSIADFRNPDLPVELEVLLQDLSPEQAGHFSDFVFFGNPQTLSIGVRAVWDSDAQEARVEYGYPRHPGARLRREDRELLPLQWLGAARDPEKMLQLGGIRNLMAVLMGSTSLGPSIEDTVRRVRELCEELGTAAELATVLASAEDTFGRLLPEVEDGAFRFGPTGVTGRDLLRQFDLEVAYPSEAVPVARQSSGVGQLAIHAFSLEVLRRSPDAILLVDEPEIALHPQAQRALMREFAGRGSQVLVATHSPSIVARADPRTVFRLRRSAAGESEVAYPSDLSEQDARRLSRHITNDVAEGFFARAVVLVEGPSDKYALAVVAERLGRNLDAEGVSIVAMGGAGLIGGYLRIFAKRGFGLSVAALCDQAEEGVFAEGLRTDGCHVENRGDLEACGFFVCETDLEDELLRRLGEEQVRELVQREGDNGRFSGFTQQERYRGLGFSEQIRAFVARYKVRYAPVLAAAIPAESIPTPLRKVLEMV
jgi:putative ATP-dependent endonuclease of the OLD family